MTWIKKSEDNDQPKGTAVPSTTDEYEGVNPKFIPKPRQYKATYTPEEIDEIYNKLVSKRDKFMAARYTWEMYFIKVRENETLWKAICAKGNWDESVDSGDLTC